MATTSPSIEPGTVRHASVAGMSGVVSTLADGQAYFYEPTQHFLHRLDGTEAVILGNPVALQIVRDVLRWMRRAYEAQRETKQ